MKYGEWLKHSAEPRRCKDRGHRRGGSEEKSRPQPRWPDGGGAAPAAAGQRRRDGGDEDQTHQSNRAIDALRAPLQSLAASIRENSSASSSTLTASLTAITR